MPNTFTDSKGNNYRDSELLNKKDIEDFFSAQGYDVIELQQIWRHVHGQLRKDGKAYFLKMASTPAVGERTENESYWNTQVGEALRNANIDSFDVPKILETGKYNGRYYFLSSFHTGRLLGVKVPLNIAGLEKWIDKIINANLFLLSLPAQNLHFVRDKFSIDSPRTWNTFYQRIEHWHEDVLEQGLTEVLQEVKTLQKTFEPGVCHGDFVPWHMIEEQDKFILIDAEHASSQSPKFYDVCYFYHRLYTTGQNPVLAKQYINGLRSRLSAKDKLSFDQSLKPVVATRIIGGFRDAKTDGVEDMKYHNLLKADFLKNTLLDDSKG